ncbi:hypothetical protein C8Q76DRAFT_791724 [Earliella scabrosa]|nr:hypothetical protein C8Q76DRAFT_791724 [Earliella scabrosa]
MPPGSATLPSSSLPELVKEPFGPWPEHEVLTPKVPDTTRQKPVRLENVILEWAGRVTGLDESEKFTPGERKDIHPDIPQRFRGTLEIQRTTWLTPEAITNIETELQARDVNARRSVVVPNPSPSTLTLKALYSSNPSFPEGSVRIKVRIQGIKERNVVFLESKYVPNGLMMTSKWESDGQSGHRRYEVASMHIQTYELSRAYLFRYRLYQVIATLLKRDANSDVTTANRVALEQRTPEWFIMLYVTHLAYHGSQRHYRPVFSSSDSDIGDDINGRLRPSREHALRHVSRAEIRSKIAEHAEWLVQDHQQRRMGKYFDVDVWEHWLPKVERMRKKAAASGRRFGVFDGRQDAMDRDDRRLSPSPKRKTRRKPTKRRDAPVSASSLRFAEMPVDEDEDSEMVEADPAKQRSYDSDFSPVSSDAEPPSSDSDDLPSRPTSPTDRPDVRALLPPEFFREPQLTPGTLRWVCAMDNCHYLIDMYNLTDENLDTDKISPSERQWLRDKSWNIRDDWFWKAFRDMVDKHIRIHLDEMGICIESVPGVPRSCRARWKDNRHGCSHLLRKVRKDDRRGGVAEDVKMEDI